MFENLLVSASVQPHRRLSAPMIAAALAHGSAVGWLLITPLLFPAVIQTRLDGLLAIIGQRDISVAPPIPVFSRSKPESAPPAAPPKTPGLERDKMYYRNAIPDNIPPEVDPAELASLWSGPSGGEGITGSLPAGIPLNAGFGFDPTARLTVGDPPAPPPPPVRAGPAAKPVPVPPTVLRSRLIHQAAPAYPVLAKAAGVQGEVTLRVLVDETGRVAEVAVLGGHALLVEAARQAVAQWRYSPTLVNGRPVRVTGLVIVRFKLNR